MAYRNKTGKCRRQLHVLAEVGRTKAGACKVCAAANDKLRGQQRDYTAEYARRRPTRPEVKPVSTPPPPTWTPSPKPYIPGHAVTVNEKLKVGRCGCGAKFVGTTAVQLQSHNEHIKSLLQAR